MLILQVSDIGSNPIASILFFYFNMKRHIFLDNKKRKLFFNQELNSTVFHYLKTTQQVKNNLNKKVMFQSYYRLQKLKLYRYRGLGLCMLSGRSRSVYLHSISRHKFLEYQAQGLLFG